MASEFAAWVAPLAASYRENRAAVVELARTLKEEQVSLLTGDEGWSVRTELTHVAASDPDFIRMLEGLLEGGPLDMGVFADIDERNARNLEAWKDRPMDEIAGELVSNGQKLQDLLARLTDEDEARQPDGMPFPLSGLINGYGQHGPYHLGQIQQALAAQSGSRQT